MTLPEQAGKVASNTIDALKASPALLVLVLLQVTTLTMILWVANLNNTHRQEREILLLKSCLNYPTEERR